MCRHGVQQWTWMGQRPNQQGGVSCAGVGLDILTVDGERCSSASLFSPLCLIDRDTGSGWRKHAVIANTNCHCQADHHRLLEGDQFWATSSYP
ncbi:hypothetical protein ACOMHN_025333 [Nucella lapillus]